MGGQKMFDANLGWKHLSEIQNSSPAELKKERIKRLIGLILGPVVFIIVLLMQTPADMTEPAKQILAITLWIVVWWVCEPIPIPATGLLAFLLIPLLGILEPAQALNYLGQSNTWMMFGIFILAGTLIEEGVAKRLALWMLSRKFASKSAGHLLLVFTVACAVVSAFLSNVAVAMLFIIIAQGLVEAMGLDSGHPVSQAFAFSNTYANQAGGILTPIGAAQNNFVTIGLCASLLSVNIRFTDFMAAGIPSGAIMTIVAFLYIRKLYKKDLPKDLGNVQEYVQKQKEELGPMSSGEKMAIFVFIFAIVLWLLPSVVGAIAGRKSDIAVMFDTIFDSAYVSIFLALICFLIPVKRLPDGRMTPLSTWTKACKHVNWGVLFLVASALLIGGTMNAEGVGLIGWFAKKIGGVVSGAPEILVVLVFIVIEMIITQFISNVPAISILTTVSVPVAMATGVNPLALAFTICFAGQMSVILPVASPQIAIIYGDGKLKMGELIKKGIGFTALTIPICLIVGYYWIKLIFPYAAS